MAPSRFLAIRRGQMRTGQEGQHCLALPAPCLPSAPSAEHGGRGTTEPFLTVVVAAPTKHMLLSTPRGGEDPWGNNAVLAESGRGLSTRAWAPELVWEELMGHCCLLVMPLPRPRPWIRPGGPPMAPQFPCISAKIHFITDPEHSPGP